MISFTGLNYAVILIKMKVFIIGIDTSVRTLIVLCYSVPVAQWLEHCVSSTKVVGSIPREHTY